MRGALAIRGRVPILIGMDDVGRILIENKALAVALWFALLFALERLRPAAAAALDDGGRAVLWPRAWHRLGRNLVLFGANALLSLAVVVPVSAWAAAHGSGLRPDWWHWTLDVLVLDFWIYWWHRANHEIPLLWRFHEIHHLDRFLDTTSAVRFHFGEVLLSALVRAAVILALGIPLSSVLLFETLVLASALFHHSNLRLPAGLERALARVVITPSIHWVHHHRIRADTDSNYGTIFSFWDPLFRTRSRTARTPDMAIGVEGREERTLPALLLRPFAPRR